MSKAIVKKEDEKTLAQRLENSVLKGIQDNITSEQRDLIFNYSVEALNTVNSDTRLNIKNIDMQKFTQDTFSFSKLGLDPFSANMLFMIPRNNGKTGKLDINFQIGYKGEEFLAKKYSVDPIKSTTLELIYEKDDFRIIKKDRNNPIETYEFTYNPFGDRGKLVGGFGYIEYYEDTKNKLLWVTKKQLDQRRQKAQTQAIWNEWETEMYYKTLAKMVFHTRNITRDINKYKEELGIIEEHEREIIRLDVDNDILQNANIETLEPDIPEIEQPEAIEEEVDANTHEITITEEHPAEAPF